MVALVNSHTNATRIGWHLWEIDLRFAPGLPPGWPASQHSSLAHLHSCTHNSEGRVGAAWRRCWADRPPVRSSDPRRPRLRTDPAPRRRPTTARATRLAPPTLYRRSHPTPAPKPGSDIPRGSRPLSFNHRVPAMMPSSLARPMRRGPGRQHMGRDAWRRAHVTGHVTGVMNTCARTFQTGAPRTPVLKTVGRQFLMDLLPENVHKGCLEGPYVIVSIFLSPICYFWHRSKTVCHAARLCIYEKSRCQTVHLRPELNAHTQSRRFSKLAVSEKDG